MSEVTTSRRGGYLDRPSSSSLADVIDTILDKGLVIDAFVRVSVVGIELITIDIRIVIASVDTYLRFAEATNRLDLAESGGRDLTELSGSMMESGSQGKTKGMLQGAKEALLGDGDDGRRGDSDEDDEEPEEEPEPRQKRTQERPRRRPVRKEQA